jgi:nucleotide-binding universal stress UspA family protein
MRRILLPVAFPLTGTGIAREAAALARHYTSEIILLHVVVPPGHPPGLPVHTHELTERERQEPTIKQAQRNLEQALLSELDGIVVRRLLHKGLPAQEIVRTARAEDADLVAMPTHSRGSLYPLLLGSTAAKVLHHVECAALTDTHGKAEANGFAIRRVLCAVQLGPHSRDTVLRAARLTADFDAKLTLVHITPGVDDYGPGGYHEVAEWKSALVAYATREMNKLQVGLNIATEVIIDNGSVRERLNHAADQTKSDLLVLGRKRPDGHLGDNGAGYAIIRDVRIPVLSL